MNQNKIHIILLVLVAIAVFCLIFFSPLIRLQSTKDSVEIFESPTRLFSDKYYDSSDPLNLQESFDKEFPGRYKVTLIRRNEAQCFYIVSDSGTNAEIYMTFMCHDLNRWDLDMIEILKTAERE